MGNGAGMGKVPPTGNPDPQHCFYLSGDGESIPRSHSALLSSLNTTMNRLVDPTRIAFYFT